MIGKTMVRAYAAAAMLCGALTATAQAQEIRLARQFSMGYLQLNVMERQTAHREARQGARHSTT